MINFLAIGDPHLRTDCLDICELFCNQIKKIIIDNEFDYVIILGDVLHNHEKINTTVLNMAVNLFEFISKKTKLYVIVGNHDYINNSQFLTSNHWMNCLNGYKNIHIIDNVVKVIHGEHKFVLCPYVPNGRLEEALNNINDWKEMDIIFAHQELRSVKINTNGRISTTGDIWCKHYPTIISGHIHHKQKIDNIIYTGSSLPTSFSDSDKKYILHFTLNNDKSFVENYILLNIPTKVTTHITINNLNSIDNDLNKNNRLIIEGTTTDFDSVEIKQQLKTLENNGVTIVKRVKENKKIPDVLNSNDFYVQLKSLIVEETNNDDLLKLYAKLL